MPGGRMPSDIESRIPRKATSTNVRGGGYSTDNGRARLNPNSKSSGKRDGSAIRYAHLQTLGLVPRRNYTLRDIKKAYNRRAIETHPDQGGSSEELRMIREAWAWLKKCTP
jgi:hypothetical protein